MWPALDPNALGAVDVVTLSVSGEGLSAGRSSGFQVRSRIQQSKMLGLLMRLITELHQRHRHGETQTTDQDVKHPGNVTETQRTRLILQHTHTRTGRYTALQEHVRAYR